MKKEQIIKSFIQEVTNHKWIVKKSFQWCINLKDTLYYAEDEETESAQAFRMDFLVRCPIAANHLDITLSILHEIGHYMTRDEMDYIYPDTYTYNEYFAAHDEMIATNWAINYIINNEERVKNFEKLLTMTF